MEHQYQQLSNNREDSSEEIVLPEPEKKNLFLLCSSFLFLATLFFIDYQTGHNLGDFDPFPKQRKMYHAMHQKDFKLDNGAAFTSNYTGGNLIYVKQSPKDKNHFFLGIADDCCQDF